MFQCRYSKTTDLLSVVSRKSPDMEIWCEDPEVKKKRGGKNGRSSSETLVTLY
jgi:hypothetical protein